MAHKHDHDTEGRLSLSLLITSVFMIGEAAGGLYTNSLALLSDAGHMFTDAFALVLSLIAARISRWDPDRRATFGYQRVGLLAAVINGLSLFVISFVIFFEAYRRFINPPEIKAGLMLVIAVLGLIANIVMAWILRHGHRDLNIKSAWLHVLGDTLSSAGVIISAVVIIFTGWTFADPLTSFLIGFIILFGGARVVSEASRVFLELAPRGFNVEEIAREICAMPEVLGVHDVHLWSLTHGRASFSAHIWVHDASLSSVQAIGEKVKRHLADKGINHVTLEYECAETESKGIFCELEEEED
ncbi:MAG: cation diffusion facilitator family transporter [Nitrospiraceae bacterium]|nr:cation diffusion facilitator family transporter [Nitrospiraceae bacterium]